MIFRSLVVLCFASCLIPLSGCQDATSASNANDDKVSPPLADIDDDELREMIDEALLYTYAERRLSLDVNAAWQILHGVLPFEMRFKVLNGDEPVPAMQWVLDGNHMNGWTVQHGAKDLPGGRRGLKMVLEGGTKAGQGHEDQWLAVMSQCRLPLDQKIVFKGQNYQLRDVLQQSMWDAYEGKEFSWSLIALSKYLDDFDTEWSASDGATWTMERIIALEASQQLEFSACGGTHRLIGMTMALDVHRERGGAVEGGWNDAQEKINEAVQTAREYQNLENGSFSTNYFARIGTSADLALRLSTTGHILEFLALALDKEQLSEPWVENAAVHLCDVFKKTQQIDLECGKLYHAAHGLMEYRERRFGPWPNPAGLRSP